MQTGAEQLAAALWKRECTATALDQSMMFLRVMMYLAVNANDTNAKTSVGKMRDETHIHSFSFII